MTSTAALNHMGVIPGQGADLSEAARTLSTMFNPWRYLAEHHPSVRVIWTRLSEGVRGLTDGKTIWMDDRLTQAQRRVVLLHELLHVERGVEYVDAAEERKIDALVAEKLISTRDLIDALKFHRHTIDGLAEQLWVEPSTVLLRLSNMTPGEQAIIEAHLGDI